MADCRDTLQLGTAGILCSWTLQGYSLVGHCRDTYWLDTAGILIGWALQGYLVVEQCRDTHWLGSAGIFIGWALQGYSAVGHCRDIHWLGTAGILGGWSIKSASSRARTTSTLISNNPTARVGNKIVLRQAPVHGWHILGVPRTNRVAQEPEQNVGNTHHGCVLPANRLRDGRLQARSPR